MDKQLPERASLEHLKGQAKHLLSTLPEGHRLADAQRILAREYGFPSWTKLKQFVESREARHVALFAAVRTGDREAAERSLRADPRLANALDKDSFDAPPLNLAATRNDVPMIELLLQYGADVDGTSRWWAGGFRALDFGDEKTSSLLIRRGATLTAHAAARLGWTEQLREIVARNPSVVFERGGDGQYPLHFAKTPEIVDVLVDAGAVLDARDLDHEGTAAQFLVQNIPVLNQLIARGASTDIFSAVMLDDPTLVRRHCRNDPDAVTRSTFAEGNPMVPKAPGEHIYTYTLGFLRPFQVAQRFGKPAALRTLGDMANATAKLMMAITANDRAQATKLQSEVSRLGSAEMAMLPEAAFDRQVDQVRLMLDLGFDVNAVGVHHSSALDRAAFHGFNDVVELVLGYGPDLRLRNEFGGTAIGACMAGSLYSWRTDGDFGRTLRLLVDAGVPLPKERGGSPEMQQALRDLGVSS